MDAKQFVEAYPLTLAPNIINSGNPTPELAVAQTWSYRFGRLLHAQLSGEPPDAFGTQKEFDQYRSWVRHMPEMEEDVLIADIPEEQRLRNRMEINFHSINGHMLDMWTPIVKGHWGNDRKRAEQLTIAQNSMALSGLFYFQARQQLVDQHEGTHILFQPDHQSFYSVLTGVIQEYDTTIVLLEFIRNHPNLTVVPAPMQFERAPRNKRRNVDFVVANIEAKKAVGI